MGSAANMNHIVTSRRGKYPMKPILWLLLALVLLSITAQPGMASTYLFAIPTTTIQNALSTYISSPPPDNPDLYAFYDIYLRPALPADAVGGNDLPSYTPQSDTSPITSGSDQWSASTGTAPFDGSNISFRFTFSPLDTVIALVTTNSNVNGKTYESRTAEQMPGTDTFTMTVSSPSALLTGTIRWFVTGVAYEFASTSATSTMAKGVVFGGATFDAAGTALPEPATLASIGGGLLLFAFALRRRGRTPGSRNKN